MRLSLLAVSLVSLSLPIATLAQQAKTPTPAVAPGIAVTPASALTPPRAAGAAAFAEEPVVLRDTKLLMQWNADGTGTRTESQAFTLQSEAAVRTFGIVSLAYASASQTAEFVSVLVRRPDGTVIDTPLTDVQEQTPPVTQQAPFYSDIKLKQIPVRGLHVGDTVEWQTRLKVTKPEAPNQFWGAVPLLRDLVTLNQTVELRLPAKTTVNVWTNPADHLTPQRTAEGNEVVYRWQWHSLQPTVGKEADAAKKAKEGKLLTADEELDETQGRLPDIAYTTFPDWAAVGAWYRGLEADRMQPDAAVRAKVAEITAHSATEQDKVRAVYDWVASNIRYIGVALGVGRYQPHAAGTVLENQYGDCKDKHTLLAAMLIALGEQPDAVLIGSGVRFNAAVPSPEAFNHLITRVTLEGKPVWLDTTSEVAAFQVLVPQIRDKDALVIPAAGVAKVERTPAAVPFAEYESMVVKGSLDKSLTSDSEIVYTLHDDMELGLRVGLRQISAAQYSEGVQRMMQFYGFGGTVSDAVVENMNDQEKPLVIRFHYHREHGSDWGENRVTATFGPTGLPAVDEKKAPTSSIQLGTPHLATSTVDMQLPEGWSAELPEATHQQLAQVRIDTTYHLDGRTLRAERKTAVLNDKVPAADWKSYQKWYTSADAGNVPYIQLVPPRSEASSEPLVKPATLTGAPQAPQAPAPKTEAERLAEAVRLVTSANEKLQRNDVDGAEKDLNAAKEFNPNQHNLSGDLGAIAYRRGNQTEAMKLYRKEVELHPDSDFAWRNIVSVESRDNLKAAEASAREWVAAAPDKMEPRTTLVGVLWAGNQNVDALAAARAAAAALPGEIREGNTFQLLLGEAELRGGAVPQGAETLSHLIQSSATPLQSNDADYELAKAHQQLTVVEANQRDVLKKLGEESLAWTGDESPATMRNASVLMTAAWDTMGFILYQEGKFAEAEAYIEPAWRHRPDAEIGEHLGDVQMALHKEREAARSYVLADFAAHGARGTSPTLKPKVDAATKQFGGDVLGGKKAVDVLLDDRTFAVPGSTDISGTAVYSILFTRNSVLRSKPSPGGTTPAQDAKIREAKLALLFPPGESAALFNAVSLVCKSGACSVRLDQ